MSPRDPDTLDHALQRVLAVYRAETTPSADEQTRLWARLAAPIVPTAVATWTGLRLVIAGVAIASASAAVLVLGERSDAPVTTAVVSRAHEPASDRAAPTPPPATPPSLPQTPVTSAAKAPLVQPQARTKPSAIERSDGLAAELALLERARASLVEGTPNQTLALLDEHERRFPKGAMTQERRAIRIVALCEAGNRIQGRAEAHDFLAAHPSAALVTRIRSACGISP